MKKFLITAAAVLLVGTGCASAPPSSPPSGAQPATPPSNPGANPPNPARPATPPPAVPNPAGVSPTNVEDRIIVFTDAGVFDPDKIAIHVGHTVTWKNDSHQDVWPIADPTSYKLGVNYFNAGKAISPGGSWSFTFKEAGTWSYHNYLKNGASGWITVTPP